MALNDRLNLRNMVIGEKDDIVYITSEESAIRIIEPNLERAWSLKGEKDVIIKAKDLGGATLNTPASFLKKR